MKLVIQKLITMSDHDNRQDWLSLGVGNIVSRDFLHENEKERLGVKVRPKPSIRAM